MADATQKIATAVVAAMKPILDQNQAAFITNQNEMIVQIVELKVAVGALAAAIDGAKKKPAAPKAEGGAAKPAEAKTPGVPTLNKWFATQYKENPDAFKHLVTPEIDATIAKIKKEVAESPRAAKTDLNGKIANAIQVGAKASEAWKPIKAQYEAMKAAAAAAPAPAPVPTEPEAPTPT